MKDKANIIKEGILLDIHLCPKLGSEVTPESNKCD